MKKSFSKTKVCGKDLWFAIHQATMGLTWLLTFSGFIIIVIDSNRFSLNPHSIMGSITFGLCLLQPFGAAFRPGIKDPSRPAFNFLHKTAGNLAQLLASKKFID